ncbi:MAG: alanine--tRNA ligase [Candidatus Dormibacteria bacterium]
MLSHDIRNKFLQFFEQHGHLRVPSAPLIPQDDPSLLLVGAGMVPFKPYYLGLQEPPQDKVTSCQKAFRTTDLELVGDLSHDTFFEMLGNFSFGSYYKAQAIAYAFELLTDGFGLDPDRLHPSVHPQDQESLRLWQEVGIPAGRVALLEENHWEAGPTGPFGVDSEIYVDLGPAFGQSGEERPGAGERYLEVWNLVFMDQNRLPDGASVPLPRPGVDTGMGLERMAMVLQGVGSIFETDLFAPLLEGFSRRSGGNRELGPEKSRHLRRLADHSRSACMLIADGVFPSNEGRGYVLRRLLRRALVSGLALELEGGLGPAVAEVVAILGPAYPELRSSEPQLVAVIHQEEARFEETLDRGMEHFQAELEGTTSRVVGAEAAFRLHDTYGFPLELSQDLAESRGYEIDREGAERLLEQQRQIARSVRSPEARREAGLRLPDTEFVGYEKLVSPARVLGIWREGQTVAQVGVGDEADVVLDRSPFYAEAGGQQGDRGRLLWQDGEGQVLDTQAAPGGGRLHRCRVLSGGLHPQLEVRAEVDQGRRRGCAQHHSATHLLNASLHRELGEGVVQRGSLVAFDRATFDFSWPRPLSPGELLSVQRRLNRAIRRDLERRVESLSLEQARQAGALALPEETYASQVRVVSFGDYSKELCGGTHVERSGEVGLAALTSEHSVGSGLRRIEMLAGEAAERWWEEQRQAGQELAQQLRVPLPQAAAVVAGLQERVRGLERELERLRQGDGAQVEEAVREEIKGVALGILRLGQAVDLRRLGQRADQLLGQLGEGCALVLSPANVVVKLSPELVARGLSAGQMAKAASHEFRGGGTVQFGQGQIASDGQAAAVASVRSILESSLEEG